MSSMTLKQFMTRGMEKDAADFLLRNGTLVFDPDPNLRRGTDPNSLEKQLLGQYILRRGTAEGVNNIANQAQGYINNAAQAMGANNPLVKGLAGVANKAVGAASKAYDQHFGGQQFAQSHGKALMSEAQSLVEYIKSIAFDDAKYKEGLEQVKTVYGPEAAAGLKAKVDGIRNIPGLKWLYETSPDLFNAFADRHIYQSIMSEFGLDPSKVNDYVTGLKDYDMNQYIPGMAAAFGIPLGIGALTGHPGWGLLLGMLGAGAYGYAKYNHIFDKPVDVKPEETPDPEAPATTPESSEDLDAPASEETTEAIPAPATEAPAAPVAAPAPAGPKNEETHSAPVEYEGREYDPDWVTETYPDLASRTLDDGTIVYYSPDDSNISVGWTSSTDRNKIFLKNEFTNPTRESNDSGTTVESSSTVVPATEQPASSAPIASPDAQPATSTPTAVSTSLPKPNTQKPSPSNRVAFLSPAKPVPSISDQGFNDLDNSRRGMDQDLAIPIKTPSNNQFDKFQRDMLAKTFPEPTHEATEADKLAVLDPYSTLTPEQRGIIPVDKRVPVTPRRAVTHPQS